MGHSNIDALTEKETKVASWVRKKMKKSPENKLKDMDIYDINDR